MPLGTLRFALVGLTFSLSLLAGCVYRPLPILDESGGGAGGSPPPTGSGGTPASGGRGDGGGSGEGGGAGGTGTGGTGGMKEGPDAGASGGRDGGGDAPEVAVMAPPPPRLIAPLSTATVTSRRPTLRWALAGGSDGAHVEICTDRACTVQVTSFDVSGASSPPKEVLPAGVLFWRAYGRSAGTTGTQPSATWQMTVGTRSAAVDTSWGTTLDVNGDGFADVIVGADVASDSDGRAYLYLGGAAGISSMPTTTLAGPAGPGGYFGISVASAGDVNGDGFADVIIGAIGTNAGDGRAFLYLGGAAGLAASPITTLIGPADTVGQFGLSVASAGDVNGDGFADVIIGEYEVEGAPGRAYLYLGGGGGLAASPIATLSNPDGADSFFGTSVAGAGDVNGDGFADVVVGDYGSDSLAGQALLYLGGATGLASVPSAILTSPGDKGGNFGASVAGAGDVNGDGYADVVIGASGISNGTGSAFLYLGGAGGLSVSPTATFTGLDVADDIDGFFGGSVAGAGDVNGDGFADFIIGASGSSGETGRAYLYLGGGSSIAPSVFLSGPAGDGGDFGVSVAGAGDVNRDGYADVVIGAYLANGQTGQAYLYFGNPVGLTLPPSATLTGFGGYYGVSVASAGGGDINGDDDPRIRREIPDALETRRALIAERGAHPLGAALAPICGWMPLL